MAKSETGAASRGSVNRVAATVACSIALSACGGGGGGGGGIVTTPPPVAATAPTPTPAPTPAPPPIAAAPSTPAGAATDTGEYRSTVGAVSMNALAAYNRGATGSGVNVAVIDTGIDTNSAEFAGRISSASQNVAGGTGVGDENGHGTAVAFAIAGGRNGTGTHGVAYDATIVALRTDTPGSCAAATNCNYSNNAIARGIDVAIAAGARVINMSMGSTDPFATNVVAAIDRATAAGLIIVISAGNGYGKDAALAANPDATAQVANNPAVARGLVIVSGSVGSSDAISATSNRAGNTAAHYLTAVGEQVHAPDHKGVLNSWSGTSFSAPQISAAVALLAQAFPNLSGRQIVDLLYATARDAGAAGDDAIYGQGVLDLTRAFQPVGTPSLATMPTAVSLTNNGTMSTPMGDAGRGATPSGLGAVILDGYGRAFAIDLANTIGRAEQRPVLRGLLDSRARTSVTRAGGMTVAMTVAPTRDGATVERTMLDSRAAEGARALAGSVTQRLGQNMGFALGFATGGGALTAQLAGQSEPAFLIARSAESGFGFESQAGNAAAFRIGLGRIGLTAAAETGQVAWRGQSDLAALDGRWQRSPYQRFALTADRRIGPLALTASVSRMSERATILGAHLGDGLGGGRAVSWYGDVGARLDLAGGWSVGGSYRQGRTQARLGGAIAGTGTITTRAWAADVGKAGLLWAGDSIGFRVSQPLRVARGGLDINLPTYWDYASQSVTQWTSQRLNLAPTGRELDFEWRYATQLGAGTLAANLFWRRQPGNIAAADDDKGAAVRYAIEF